MEALVGAQLIGHTKAPDQVQDATVPVVQADHSALQRLPRHWRRQDEWYAFDRVPGGHGTRILARLDQDSYQRPPEQRMGEHPSYGRAHRTRLFYYVPGHQAETCA